MRLRFAYELLFLLIADTSVLSYQMGAVETSFDEVQNIFDTGGAKGLSGDLVEKIPKIKITTDNNFDASGDRVSCSVCLQVSFYTFPCQYQLLTLN